MQPHDKTHARERSHPILPTSLLAGRSSRLRRPPPPPPSPSGKHLPSSSSSSRVRSPAHMHCSYRTHRLGSALSRSRVPDPSPGERGGGGGERPTVTGSRPCSPCGLLHPWPDRRLIGTPHLRPG